MPEPYVSEEADEARPEAFDQAPTSEPPAEDQIPSPPRPPPPQTVPGSRRETTLPVRFAEPLTAAEEAATQRRPFRQVSRERPLERRGRGRSPFLDERGRQTSSPSPIRQLSSDEPRDRYEEIQTQGLRGRSPQRPPSPDGRRAYESYGPSRATDRDSRPDFFSEENAVYTPSYLAPSRVPNEPLRLRHYHGGMVSEIPSRRNREEFSAESHDWPRKYSFSRPIDTRDEPVNRDASRYDVDDDWDSRYRGSRKPSLGVYDQSSQPFRYGAPDYEDGFRKRTAMTGDTYLLSRSYQREGYIPPYRRRSTTYDEDDVDIKIKRRERSPYLDIKRYPAPGQNPFSPGRSDFYRTAMFNHDRSCASPTSQPPPVIRKKFESSDSSDDDSEMPTSRKQPRSRSRTPSPPRAAAPVMFNNRTYKKSRQGDDKHIKLDYPSYSHKDYARSRSIGHSYAPKSIHSRVQEHYYDDEYEPNHDHESEPDLGIVPEAYQFTLSRHSKSLQGTESILSSSSDISDLLEKIEPHSKAPTSSKSESGTTYHVLRSYYVGDSVIGGSHAVQLSLSPDGPSPNSRGISSVFRWVHFEDQTMDFDNFEHNALNIPGLTDPETTAISKVLGRAKKSYDKPLQTATKGKTRFMVPSFLQENVREEKRPSASRVRTVSWLCAPYFCLAKYATNLGLKPSSHPMRTLLQARFALVQKERDMKQAVRYLQDTPPEHCFHIAQVWFLILDNSLVISCARMSIESIQGDYISILPKPEIQPSLGPNFLVSTKSSLLWSLPLEQCQSWFGFVSHFCEYWPLQVNVTYNEKPITASEWPRMLALAKKTTVRLVIELRSCTKSEPAKGILLYEEDSPREVDDDSLVEVEDDSSSHENRDIACNKPSLQPTDHKRSNSSKNQSTEPSKEEFHVFTWINCQNQSQDPSSRTSPVNVDHVVTGLESQGVDDDLAEIDTYLSTETSLSHRRAYNRCPSVKTKDRSKIYRLMSSLQLYADTNEEDRCYENLSISFGTSTRSRNTTNRRLQAELTALELLNWLELINKATSPFKDYLTHVPMADRSDIQMPEELTTAWLHLILGFAVSIEDVGLFENQMAICHDLVIRGVKKAIPNVSKVDLSDFAVFQPFDFASLIAFQLPRDQTGSAADISDTYLEYLKTLQSDIEGNPLDRSHQDRIVCLKQEIEVISETLDAQQYVLRHAQRGYITSQGGDREEVEHAYSRHVERRTAGHFHPDLAGVQSVIIQDNLALVENQIRGFREMREIASELGDWNIQKIDSNKDRQEAAIYAFTIVTIIFLPLGTVAGIMGMNTSDIRDMPYAQWVYWATALPLTILVIALCLAWAGELSNFQEGFRDLWRRKPRNYEMVREGYEGLGRRIRNEEVGFGIRRQRERLGYGGKESFV